MEKSKKERIKRVVLIGAESTGKTELSSFLAKQYNTLTVPEYAREYILNLNRKYTYQDVEHIARKQLELEDIYSAKANRILFYDTYLIITKIWFQMVFNKIPDWIEKHIKNSNIDLFLLCNNDLPWIPDPVRENGGEMRGKLYEMYKAELMKYGFKFEIVRGVGEERYKQANKVINDFLKSN